MSQPYRLSAGGLIDRETDLGFTINGQKYVGHPGDTVASALLANGIRIIGRSFKYHRPRGIFGIGIEEPNALLQLGKGAKTLPNQQATRVELYQGLTADSVNCWPGPDFDLMSIIGIFQRLIPAGFYYKTFMWPGSFWRYYEYFIRKAAGLGKAPTEADPDQYDKMNIHVDVLIVGAGPAGLSAGLSAALTGARVMIADEQSQPGGWLLNEQREINDRPASEWVASVTSQLAKMDNVHILSRTTAFGHYDHNFIGMIEQRTSNIVDGGDWSRQRLWRVRAKEVILATGAIERPLIFADNDRPGVMLASAVRGYANRYGVSAGHQVSIFTNNDDAYRTAIELNDFGINVIAIIDIRKNPSGALVTEAIQRRIDILDGCVITAVHGRKCVTGIDVMKLNKLGDGVVGTPQNIKCDVICSSGGWNPSIHLHSHSGGKAKFDEERALFLPAETSKHVLSIGSAAGDFSLSDCLLKGSYGGKTAAKRAGFKSSSRLKPARAPIEEEEMPRLIWVAPGKKTIRCKQKCFLDQANDVTTADIQLAAREGYTSIEHVKRYTTLGMAPDQGKTGNIPGMAVLGHALGSDSVGQIGTTTFRPPYSPVTIGALAGRDIGPLMDPVRMTPIHQWHEQANCKFEDVGQWKRPWYYPKPGEKMQDTINRECLAVRNAVGILDASTLGKIDIRGPDAIKFLNRIYTNDWDTLENSRCRYGLMLGEDGMVMDDGVTTRLTKEHFFMTTTSGNASTVLEWLEEWSQTEWPDLKVYFTSVTEQFANITISGPRSRELLMEFTSDINLDPTSFPFMSVRHGNIAGVPARVFRISFTGEISYEINVPGSYGLGIWTALINAGEKYGITPYGTETMHVLRAEKGYIVVGQETDGTTTPQDLGLDWILSKNKDFLGRRSFLRENNQRNDRKQLVGLLPENKIKVLPEGSQITLSSETLSNKGNQVQMIGHITSSYYSANLGRSFALALIKEGRKKQGDTVYVTLPDGTFLAKITSPIFVDPVGAKKIG